MARRTRKQMVGKPIENAAIAQNDRLIRVIQRLVQQDWWAQKLGQIPARDVLPPCPCERRRRERARREFLTMDPFEHREE